MSSIVLQLRFSKRPQGFYGGIHQEVPGDIQTVQVCGLVFLWIWRRERQLDLGGAMRCR